MLCFLIGQEYFVPKSSQPRLRRKRSRMQSSLRSMTATSTLDPPAKANISCMASHLEMTEDRARGNQVKDQLCVMIAGPDNDVREIWKHYLAINFSLEEMKEKICGYDPIEQKFCLAVPACSSRFLGIIRRKISDDCKQFCRIGRLNVP